MGTFQPEPITRSLLILKPATQSHFHPNVHVQVLPNLSRQAISDVPPGLA